MRIDHVLQKPMITEGALQKVKSSVYAFYVNKNATKHQIKASVERLFEVKIASIRTIIRKGKIRKVGKRMVKKQATEVKIAYIHVIKGKINLFPQT